MRGRLGRRIAGALLVGAAAWFLTDAIASNWQALRGHAWRVDPLLLGTSIAIHVAVLVWGVVVWARVLSHFSGASVPLRILLRIWFLSNLARYIPGKIFQFLAVAHLGRGAGVPSAGLVASLLVHTAFALLSASLIAAWTLAGQLLPSFPSASIGITASLGAVLLVHPTLLNGALGLATRLSRRDVLRWQGTWGDGLFLLVLSILNWMLYGAAYYLFVVSLTPLPLGALPVLAGVNALSFVAGYLVIITPGGLGVREAAMTLLLLPLLPRSVAAVLAVASRLWTIAAEILGGVVVVLMARRVPPTPDAASGSAIKANGS